MSTGHRNPARDQDRRLSSADARTYLEAPLTGVERDAVRELVHWFCRRYPTPIERLAYVRRAYARWQRTQGTVAHRTRNQPFDDV